MANLPYFIGLDIAKKDLKACLAIINDQQKVTIKPTKTCSNTLEGYKLFYQWLNQLIREQLASSLIMEASGVYHEQLAWLLFDQRVRVSLLLPNKAKG